VVSACSSRTPSSILVTPVFGGNRMNNVILNAKRSIFTKKGF